MIDVIHLGGDLVPTSGVHVEALLIQKRGSPTQPKFRFGFCGMHCRPPLISRSLLLSPVSLLIVSFWRGNLNSDHCAFSAWRLCENPKNMKLVYTMVALVHHICIVFIWSLFGVYDDVCLSYTPVCPLYTPTWRDPCA